jgi:hypothetical protein
LSKSRMVSSLCATAMMVWLGKYCRSKRWTRRSDWASRLGCMSIYTWCQDEVIRSGLMVGVNV